MPVATSISDIRARLVSDVDARWAETIRLFPMANGRTDASRERVQIAATLRAGSEKEGNLTGGSSQSWGSRLSAGKAELRIDKLEHPDLIIRKGDRISAPERPGEPMWEVAYVNDRVLERLVLNLTEL